MKGKNKKETVTVKAVRVKCHRCEYKWLYHGEKERVVCGKCKTSVMVDPKRRLGMNSRSKARGYIQGGR